MRGRPHVFQVQASGTATRRTPKGRVSTQALLAGLLLLSLARASFAQAQSPAVISPTLHERIDLAIAAGGPPPELCSDADFLRRVYLDLAGMVPSAAESRAFLADTQPEKRTIVIDALLADPRFARRMADVFDAMLMERREDRHVKSPEWEKYLYESFVANKPLNELCREILSADGVDPAKRPAARFYLDREMDPNLLTRDVGRIFFGKDLQCAQCHDHPLISDYYQTDYYGIFAYLQRSYLFEDKQAKLHVLGEKAEGEASYQSVFEPDSKGLMPPMLPGGAPMVEPVMPVEEAYLVKPDKDVRSVPKFSRREALAAAATSGQNIPFNRNLANRLWAKMMGRGLVEPVDLHHADNPPTHPALLEDLTASLAAMNFSAKDFIRELVLSRTYQREVNLPSDLQARVAAAAAVVTKLEVEQATLVEALKPLEAQLAEAEKGQASVRTAAEPLAKVMQEAQAAVMAAQKPAEEAIKALTEMQQQVSAKADLVKTITAAATQTAAAVAQLPEDAELKAAAAKFDERAKQLSAEMSSLTEAATAREAAANAATAALTMAREKLMAAQTQLTEVNTRVEAARLAHTTALEAVRAQKLAAAQVEQFAKASRIVSEAGHRLSAGEVAQQRVTQAEATLQTLRTSLEQVTADLTTKQAAQIVAEKAAAEAAAQVTAAVEQTKAKQIQVAELAAALVQAEAAKAKLPDDAAIAGAAAMVKQSHDAQAALLTELQKQQATLEQTAASANTASAEAAKLTAAVAAQKVSVEQQMPVATQAIETARAELVKAESTMETARGELLEQWSQRFVVGTLQPLTAEQLTWSLLQVTGIVERQIAAAEAEWNMKEPLDATALADPARVAMRKRQVFDLAYERLNANVNGFVNLFSAAPGQPQDQFFATVDQALFFANGNVVQNWIAGGGGGQLLARLNQPAEPAGVADELYVSVLNRKPTSLEIEDVSKYLATRGAEQKAAALQELVWALVTSSEFRFNH